MRENDVALMSYCPLAQAGSLRKGLFTNPVLQEIAAAHHCDVTQVLLSWNIRDGRTIAIPRSGSRSHTLLNAGADQITLTVEELARIDQAYPAPGRKIYLDMQ
jgi:diketogulonate reductase-like aldo/keto reductase